MAARRPRPKFLSLGFAAISWIETYLVHGPGDVQGKPIELDDEFGAFTLKSYRHTELGKRIVRRAFLSRAKGRNKSGFAAMIECWEALGPCRFDHWAERGEISDWGYEYEPGEPVGRPLTYAEILNVATEEGQAGNSYDAVYYMLNPETASPQLVLRYGKLDVGLTRINLPNNRGFIEPVTAANESKDGGKSTLIVADETHLWTPPAKGVFKLGKMHQTMVRNLLKRKIASGWMLETSTMYAEGEGSVAEGTHNYARQLAETKRGNTGRLLFDHVQASDHWDLNKRGERLKALREAYGPAASWMDLGEIADYWDDPQASHAEFRRFFLNQPVPTIAPVDLVMPMWPSIVITQDEIPPPACLGLAVDLDRIWASLGASSMAGEEYVPHLGSVLKVRLATDRDELLAEAKRLARKYGIPVAGDEKGQAAELLDDLEQDGIAVIRGKLEDYKTACSDVFDAVEAQRASHGNYPDLNNAVRSAGWRKVGNRQVWAATNGDITMLEADTWAAWGTTQAADFAMYGAGSLDLCDRCEKNPHEDPDGEHDYLCPTCREA